MFAKKFLVSALVAIVFLAGVNSEASGQDDQTFFWCDPGDKDCDGRPDEKDDCPDVPGAKSAEACGCPDVDADRIPEDVGQCISLPCPRSKCLDREIVIDLCPPAAELSSKKFSEKQEIFRDFIEVENGIFDLDGCRGKEMDEDGDGVVGLADYCSNLKGQAKFNGCLGPENDTDGDGTKDDKDDCPDVPGTSSQKGCSHSEYEAIYGSRFKEYLRRPGASVERKDRSKVAFEELTHGGLIKLAWKDPPGSKKREEPKEATTARIDRDALKKGLGNVKPTPAPESTTTPKAPVVGRVPEPVLVDGEVEIKDGEDYTWVPPPVFKEVRVEEATPTPEPPKAEPSPEPEPAKPASPPLAEKPEEKKPEPPPAEKAEPPKAEPTPEPEVKPIPPTPAPEPITAPKAPVVVEEVVEPDPEPSPEYVEPEPSPEHAPEPEPEPEPAKPASPPLAESPIRPEPSVAPSEEPADDRDDAVQPWSMGPCPVQDQSVNYIWTGAVGAIPPPGTSTCPAGKIPGVMGTADPIRGGRRGQDDLDGRRATRVAPPDWDGGWCSLGITTIIGNSVGIRCVEPMPTSVGLPGTGDIDQKIRDEVERQLAGRPLPPDLTKDVEGLKDRVQVLEDTPKSLVDWSAYPTVGVRFLPGVVAASFGAGLTFVDDWFVAEVEVAYTRAKDSYIHNYGVEAGFRPFGVRLGSIDILSVIRVGQYAWAPFTLWQERQWGAGVAVSIRPFGGLIELDAELLSGEGWFPSSDPFTGHIQMTGQVTLRLKLGAKPK